MIKIILLGARGTFAEQIADKIRTAAEAENFSCEVKVIAYNNLFKLRGVGQI